MINFTLQNSNIHNIIQVFCVFLHITEETVTCPFIFILIWSIRGLTWQNLKYFVNFSSSDNESSKGSQEIPRQLWGSIMPRSRHNRPVFTNTCACNTYKGTVQFLQFKDWNKSCMNGHMQIFPRKSIYTSSFNSLTVPLKGLKRNCK